MILGVRKCLFHLHFRCVLLSRPIFDREHTMRKRSYNLVCCCCCCSVHLTLLSRGELKNWDDSRRTFLFVWKLKVRVCVTITTLAALLPWRPCCPGGLAALALLPWYIDATYKTFENVFRINKTFENVFTVLKSFKSHNVVYQGLYWLDLLLLARGLGANDFGLVIDKCLIKLLSFSEDRFTWCHG